VSATDSISIRLEATTLLEKEVSSRDLDISLVTSLVKGDKRAFKGLYEEYAGLFFTIARRYTDSNEEAEDMVQESFVQIYKKAHTFSFNGSFEGWMKRVVVNMCLTSLKKKRIKADVGSEQLADDINVSQSAWFVESMDAEDIIKAFSLLPTGPRVVLNLHVMDGYNHKEISKILGITESASRSQLTKARARLKQILLEKDLLES
jgi:RNA polymerase sigma-70 factor, ECF subfamily